MSYSNKYTFAALPRTQRGTPLVLGGDPKGKNFLYTNGNSVIIRDIENPAISDVYTEHSCQVNVAKYSPSGFYIASGDFRLLRSRPDIEFYAHIRNKPSQGDASGKVRIWDTVNKEHILKNEFHPIGGPIKDIAWSADSQRMVVVGEGREKFGHVFMAETGTSVGEISGQSKPINSVDFRPSRPFRIVTASEDNTIAVFEGPPFKFKCTKQEHTRFAQAVRYSPDGGLFASAGFDGKIYLYDGATSELKGEIGSHKGGVYGISWSPDGKRLLSCSGDKTCAVWDIETMQPVWDIETMQRSITFNMGNAVENQQTESRATISEGRHIGGTGHGNQVNGMSVGKNGSLLTCGIDDSLRYAVPANEGDAPTYTDSVVTLGSQPRAMDHVIEDDLTVVATVKELIVLMGNNKQSTLPVNYEPTCVAIDPKLKHIAVGVILTAKSLSLSECVECRTGRGTSLSDSIDDREALCPFRLLTNIT
ncbi:Actin-interacting protein 1 [Papilio machaon]|uniref:Actin-interacting protein 1 n=1 Tax=Papilio machaon TaxID=76193 RepID=A0A194RKX0_PAPMA|nr:Actin-interacting protein 1 [Papilio machaon]